MLRFFSFLPFFLNRTNKNKKGTFSYPHKVRRVLNRKNIKNRQQLNVLQVAKDIKQFSVPFHLRVLRILPEPHSWGHKAFPGCREVAGPLGQTIWRLFNCDWLLELNGSLQLTLNGHSRKAE